MKKNIFSAIFGSSKKTSGCPSSSQLGSRKTKTRTIMTTLLYTFVYFFSLFQTSAQVIHQSFEMGERKAITLSLDIPYEVETWAGNTILTETKVRMENIPPNILKHFIDQGRYEIVEELSDNSVALKLKELNRRPIRTKNGEAIETIKIRIFVPEDCTVNRLGKGSLAIEDTGE